MAKTYPELYRVILNFRNELVRPDRYEGDTQPGPLISDLCWDLVQRCGMQAILKKKRERVGWF